MPRYIDLDDEERYELGEFIDDCWFLDNLDRQDWLQDLPQWLRVYHGRPEQKDEPWEGASNLAVPVTRTVVDSYHPRLMAALFRPDPIVAFTPQEPSQYERAKRRERFMDWACREDVNLFPILDRGTLAQLVNGIQVYKLTWDLRTRKVKDKHEFPLDMPVQEAVNAILKSEVKLTEALQRVGDYEDISEIEGVKKNGRKVKLEIVPTTTHVCIYTEREEVIKDGPQIVPVNPEDFVCESNATWDVQEHDHDIHRYWMTVDEIKREVRKGIFKADDDDIEKLKLMAMGQYNPSRDHTQEVKVQREDAAGVVTVIRQSPSPEGVELLDAYVKWDIDDDGFDEEIIVTCPREEPSILLRVNRLEDVYRHGMRPFVVFSLFPIADMFWSHGVPHMLQNLQDEFNTIHNQRVDAGTIANMPYGWYVPSAGLAQERLPLVPGYMQPVDDINSVKMNQPANWTAWQSQEEANLWVLTERLTKVNDLTQGRIGESQGATRTATGVSQLASQSATGFDILIRRQQEGFRKLLEQLQALYAQYMPPLKEVRIVGDFDKPPVIVTKEDLTGAMSMKFTGNSLSTDREIERQTLTFLAQSAMNPQAQAYLMQLGILKPQGVAEWYKHLFDVFDVSNRDKILSVPDITTPASTNDIMQQLLDGVRVIPVPGENHQAVLLAIQKLMNGPDAPGLSPEQIVVIQEQVGVRQQVMTQEMIQQQMAMAQMQAVQAGGPPLAPVQLGQGVAPGPPSQGQPGLPL